MGILKKEEKLPKHEYQDMLRLESAGVTLSRFWVWVLVVELGSLFNLFWLCHNKLLLLLFQNHVKAALAVATITISGNNRSKTWCQTLDRKKQPAISVQWCSEPALLVIGLLLVPLLAPRHPQDRRSSWLEKEFSIRKFPSLKSRQVFLQRMSVNWCEIQLVQVMRTWTNWCVWMEASLHLDKLDHCQATSGCSGCLHSGWLACRQCPRCRFVQCSRPTSQLASETLRTHDLDKRLGEGALDPVTDLAESDWIWCRQCC